MPVILFVHLTWTTYLRYLRKPMIGSSEARFLGRFLPAEAQRHGGQIIAMGMVSDHGHLILRLPAKWDLPRVVQGLKGASARLATQDQAISGRSLRWARGYHAQSVGPRQLSSAVEYVKRQAQRHPERAIPGDPALSVG